MNPRKVKKYIDLLFCCIFLPLIIALVPVEKWMTKYPSFAITLVLFLYCVYFIIRAVNIPRLVMRRKFVQSIGIVGGLLIATFLLSQFPYPDNGPEIIAGHPRLHEHLRSQTVWFMFLVVSGYSLSISLLIELFRQILVKREIEEQKGKAELSLYKAQINPHFMFNTLNTLYGLTINKSDKAEDAFVKFIEMLKYTYTQVKLDMIPVRNELKYISDYIALQQLRLNNHTSVSWKHEIEDENFSLPPMLLITFVENAFKYGSSSSRDCEIDICAEIKNGKLEFSVRNNIMRAKTETEMSVGIENCKARLRLLYPNRHKLVIDDNNGVFNVLLEIEL